MTSQLPDPLVPPDVDLNGLGFMPMKHLKVLQSTLFVKSTGDEFKAAFALWCTSWTEVPAGSLPDDELMLETFSRSKVWAKVRERALHRWVRCSDGRLYHPVIAELALDAWERRDEFREKQENKETRQGRWRQRVKELSEQLRQLGVVPPTNAKAKVLEALIEHARASRKASPAASTRPSTEPSTKASHETSHVDAGATALTVGETGTETVRGTSGSAASTDATAAKTPPAPLPPGPPAEGTTKVARGERLPKDWVLPKSWGDWAIHEYPYWTVDVVRRIALKFANHWQSKTGKDATKLDWEKTWQNWCTGKITQSEFPPPRGGMQAAGSLAEQMRTHMGLPPELPLQGAIDV